MYPEKWVKNPDGCMAQNSRIIWIDCLRALLIIGMVFGHASSPFTTYIYMMHIPGFFVVSGFSSYMTRRRATYRPLQFILRRAVSLLIPAFLINIIFILIYCFFEQYHMYSIVQSGTYTSLTENLRALVFCLQTPDLGGATWFLFVLFECEVIFTLFHWLGLRLHCPGITYSGCLLCGVFGQYFSTNTYYLPYLIDLALLATFYYAVGYLVADYDILNKIDRHILNPLCVLLTIFFGALWYRGRLPMNWPTRQFSDLFIQIVSVFASLYLVYGIAMWISRQKYARLLASVGQRTYCILVTHFLVFKLIFLGIYLSGIKSIPLTYLQNLTPTYDLTRNGGWLLITIITVALCMCISHIADHYRVLNYTLNAKWRVRG